MFFTFQIFKNNNFFSNSERSFIFTVFIFLVLFILNFLQPVDFSEIYKNNSIFVVIRNFINPLLSFYNSFCTAKNLFFENIFTLFIFFTPLFFTLILFLNNKLLIKKNKIELSIDKKITNDLLRNNSTLIFGDSLSKYPFIFSFIVSSLVIIFIIMESQVLSDFFYQLITTLQIAAVFKLNFLIKENINLFFNITVNFIIIIISVRLLVFLFSSFLSHFMLFADEIVFIDNKFMSKTVLRIPVAHINYFVIKQNLLEKLLDIGTIFFETTDKNGLIMIKGISSINEKNKLIMENIKIGIQKVK